MFVKLVDERSGLPEAPRSSEEVSVPLPADLKCPATGPPVKWLDEHGVSLKCSACKEIEIRGTGGIRITLGTVWSGMRIGYVLNST